MNWLARAVSSLPPFTRLLLVLILFGSLLLLGYDLEEWMLGSYLHQRDYIPIANNEGYRG